MFTNTLTSIMCLRCGDKTCINNTKVCDFNTDCKDGSDEKTCGPCDFESGGFCGWQDMSTGRFNWTVYNDKSSSNSEYYYITVIRQHIIL